MDALNTIAAAPQHFSKPEKENAYTVLMITSKSRNKITGTLRHWDAAKAPNLVCLTSQSGDRTLIERADIESITYSA